MGNVNLNTYRKFVTDAEKLYQERPNETQKAVLEAAKSLLKEKTDEFTAATRADQGLSHLAGGRALHLANGNTTVAFEPQVIGPALDPNTAKKAAINEARTGYMNGLLNNETSPATPEWASKP